MRRSIAVCHHPERGAGACAWSRCGKRPVDRLALVEAFGLPDHLGEVAEAERGFLLRLSGFEVIEGGKPEPGAGENGGSGPKGPNGGWLN